MRRGSSLRLMLEPNRRGVVAMSSPRDCKRAESNSASARAHLAGGGLHGLDDVVIARAAAEVALEAFADLLLARARVLLEQAAGRHDHARRTEAALQTVLLPEALLHGVQLAVPGKALDGGHLAAVGLDREERAGLHRPSVEPYRAGAALAGVAAHVGAGEAQRFAEIKDEQQAGRHLALAPPGGVPLPDRGPRRPPLPPSAS